MENNMSFFFDIDGTIIDHTTEKPLDDSIEYINWLYDQGHTIILTTQRGESFTILSRYSKVNTERLLRNLKLKYHHILYDIPSPRIIINDNGCYEINNKTNGSFQEIKNKIQNILNENEK